MSTRFLVLYWFARPEDGAGGAPGRGFAVPPLRGGAVVRNRITRPLRECWSAPLARVPAGSDYVLIARPGLPETVEAQGFEWLKERVAEVLQKAAA